MSKDFIQKLSKFCDNLSELEKMSEHFSDFYLELMEQPDDDSSVWHKLDANLTHTYANTSYYWIYLCLKGSINKDDPITTEVNRVRKYMSEFAMLKKDAPKLEVKVARRFIRHALTAPVEAAAPNKRPQDEEYYESQRKMLKKLKD